MCEHSAYKPEARRLRLSITGVVQGVGFRPFVYRLAHDLHLGGFVCNSPNGVEVEIEGPGDRLDDFLGRIKLECPPHASVERMNVTPLKRIGEAVFSVVASTDNGDRNAPVLPDLAVCPDCLREMLDKNDRRFRYPFINCTNCGPRYSIIHRLPYDREHTTMREFVMCEQCRTEYEDPANRRFHAQPNACPACGPHLELWDIKGRTMGICDDALVMACRALRDGWILALKGLGGFQLLVDARSDSAVTRLRRRKVRPLKPFALMYPDLASVRRDCRVSETEAAILTSSRAPIVLLQRISEERVAGAVAPKNPCLGVMLPYTPLHYLLMAELNFPVVATSGNLSEEPICIDEHEALDRLGGIADVYLVHNRPIARPLDDSVVRIGHDRELVIRSARGYAPRSIALRKAISPGLATGAHLKNSIAICTGDRVLLSQHIGDLSTARASDTFRGVIRSLSDIYSLQPEYTACDKHPDYLSTREAEERKLPVTKVQHHYAHVLSGMADNDLEPPVLGVAWDGTGLGDDGTIWGGEFLHVRDGSYSRVAHLRTFHLPGGDQAIIEPRRAAMGMLYEVFSTRVFTMDDLAPIRTFSDREKTVVREMLVKKINAPVTSSAGRVFDAVASLLNLAQRCCFEGQAAMAVEFAADPKVIHDDYSCGIWGNRPPYVIDWEPMLHELLRDLRSSVSAPVMAARFHNTLAKAIHAVAVLIGEKRIVLTGGCFQNMLLTESTVRILEQGNFKPFTHYQVPPNDGGIALGQIMAVARARKEH